MTTTSQPHSFDKLLQSAEELLNAGKDNEDIRKALQAAGADQSTLDSIISQIRSLRYLRRRKRGFIIGAIGSGILIVGFFLTVILFHHGSSFNAIMYGMTSIGVIMLLIGMVEIMGW